MLAQCIVGRSDAERTPCAIEAKGMPWLWKACLVCRGIPGKTTAINGSMYCTRHCLRAALRVAANKQRYVTPTDRHPKSGNYDSVRVFARSRTGIRWLLRMILVVKQTVTTACCIIPKLLFCPQSGRILMFYACETSYQCQLKLAWNV